MLPAPGLWILLGLATWLAAGLVLAWVFGGACRLGGSQDPRIVRCSHGLPMSSSCDRCERLSEAHKMLPLAAATTVELNIEAR